MGLSSVNFNHVWANHAGSAVTGIYAGGGSEMDIKGILSYLTNNHNDQKGGGATVKRGDMV
ncbi:MAG: hypothetical protein STSR0009_31070 [Methanoregula sp.]